MKEEIKIKDVYAISEGTQGDDKSSRWTKIGVAFVNRDESINVILDAIPVNGRLQIRDRSKQKKAA